MTTLHIRHGRGGQALAELAIFGGIMLIALAGLVRIGLRYNYAQQASQEAFRRALLAAHDRQPAAQGSVQVYHDRYIPDPSRPFAVGQTSLFGGAAAVSWGNRMQVHQINLEQEIPTSDIYINESSTDPDAPAHQYRGGRFMAWIASPWRQFRRLAHVFCDSHADTEEELNACADAMQRERRNIVNGEITLNRRDGVLQVPVVGGEGLTARHWTVILMDNCAGQMNEAATCHRQCLRIKCGPNANTPTEINACLSEDRNFLPLPGYCTVLLDPDDLRQRLDYPHGVDNSNYVRRVTFGGTVTGAPAQQTSSVTQTESIDSGPGVLGRVIRSQNEATFTDETEPAPYHDHGTRSRTRTWTTP